MQAPSLQNSYVNSSSHCFTFKVTIYMPCLSPVPGFFHLLNTLQFCPLKNGRTPFFLWLNKSPLDMYHTSSFIGGPFGWCHTFTIVNSTTVSIGIQVSLWYADFISCCYTTRGGIIGSQHRFCFSF